VRDLDLFYKLFLINPVKRTSVQICPFVKSGVMHNQFVPHLRKDGLGIDYSKVFFQQYDTAAQIDKIFASQRPGGEQMIRNAMKNKNYPNLKYALENAKRIKLDVANPELMAKGEKFLREQNKQ
jgi:hypothetical protein